MVRDEQRGPGSVPTADCRLPTMLTWIAPGGTTTEIRAGSTRAAVGDKPSNLPDRNDSIAGFVGDRCVHDPHNHVLSTDSREGVGWAWGAGVTRIGCGQAPTDAQGGH